MAPSTGFDRPKNNLLGWDDVDIDDDQEAALLGEWRAVQDDPPLGVVGIEIPKGLCRPGQPCPQQCVRFDGERRLSMTEKETFLNHHKGIFSPEVQRKQREKVD